MKQLLILNGQDRATTSLSENDTKRILERALAPTFKLISLKEVQTERTKNVFKRMLKEQVALLDYLEEQNNAIINGLAGTGKTVMALKKAEMHSNNNEEVLFLCYNAFLKEHLKRVYHFSHVHYYTIDGLACKICETKKADYALLKDKLEEMYCEGSFPYQHVIIDEGQDFGKIEAEEEALIDLLKENAISNEDRNGTFYLFYDKNQMIQSRRVPKYIEDADCKLTLYRNCRNTENIALTSLRLLGSKKKPKLLDGAVLGDIPEIGFATGVDDTLALLNAEINKYIDAGFTSITVLTCKTEESSIIADYCNDSKYNYEQRNIKFTTCRKFKGLESDGIILVDMDMNSFKDRGYTIKNRNKKMVIPYAFYEELCSNQISFSDFRDREIYLFHGVKDDTALFDDLGDFNYPNIHIKKLSADHTFDNSIFSSVVGEIHKVLK